MPAIRAVAHRRRPLAVAQPRGGGRRDHHWVTNGLEWHLAYDLARGAEQIERTQEGTLTKPGFGFQVEPALFGSPEWRRLIERGALPAREQAGVIRRVYSGSMGDWPESSSGLPPTPQRRRGPGGDVRRYVEGLHARIHYLELKGKPDTPIEPDRLRKVSGTGS